jgi:AAA domain
VNIREELVRGAVHHAFELRGQDGFAEACARVVHLDAIAPLIEHADAIREADELLARRDQARADFLALIRDTDRRGSSYPRRPRLLPDLLTEEEHGYLGAMTGTRSLDGDPGPEDRPLPLEPGTPAPSKDDAPFRGLIHDEALALELPPERYLVNDLIPVGGVGTIAGVPETHKTFVAQATAVRVARGAGEILGCPVAQAGRVGSFWQDDATREELERIKLFERVHAGPSGLALWWFLNLGLELPRDLDRLRATIDELRLDLVILDSFYNVATTVDLKDEGAERIVALLKLRIADATGCTVLIVDHMPWATEANRQRLRAYGGVFKNAATRFGIYIDAVGTNLHVEARGNNIVGFKKTPAYWDADTLELRLVDIQHADEEELDERVLTYVTDHPGEPQKTIEGEVEGGRESIRKALERLASHELLAKGPGRYPRGKYWYPASHYALHSPGDTQATLGDYSPELSQAHVSPDSPAPYRGASRPATPCAADQNEASA